MAHSVDALVLAVGSEPPRENVEQDHDRSGQQQSSNQAKADQQHINPGPVGKAGGYAHDLALGPVEDKTIVHLHFLLSALGHAIGTLVAALTNSIAVMKAAARAVAVSRAEVRANISISLFQTLDWVMPHLMQGACQFKNSVVFQYRAAAIANMLA